MPRPETALPVAQQQGTPRTEDPAVKRESPVSEHKVNYFSLNHSPSNPNAQVKFQFSMKFRLLKPDLYVFNSDLFPAYIAYTQKSLWNVGQPSLPFEETDYNPEFLLDYPVNLLSIGRFKLRNIVVSPLEHESNGLDGPRSRSWNRQYVLFRFIITSREELEATNSFLKDKAQLYVKLWRASGTSDEDDFLRSRGSHYRFLDYMGRGEVGVSVRNFLWKGTFKNHQLDFKTPVFRGGNKPSYELQFRQQLPNMNFALYLQYWYGYGETLLRFNNFGRRNFAGLSFTY